MPPRPLIPDPAPPRIRITAPTPRVACGQHPARRCVGDVVTAGALVVRDGHEQVRAALQFRGPGGRKWSEVPMRPDDLHLGGGRWSGVFEVDAPGTWEFRVVAWVDPVATWVDEVGRKAAAGQDDLSGEVSEGIEFLRGAARRARGEDRAVIADAIAAIAAGAPPEALLDARVVAAAAAHGPRHGEERGPSCVLAVDPVLARFGSWYELFPRSWGGFAGVRQALPAFAEAGFDVLYLPPIHPIGVTHRKGRGNAAVAGPDDPGSPWAIGSADGGHMAIHPELGTAEDFAALVADAREAGIEIALDLALQCSPDHPWVRKHPEWFRRRPDGTIAYAENPPKRYQDIHNLDFDSPDWKALWRAIHKVVMHWVGQGVKVFRVDNPHTKPLGFWEWLITAVRSVEPEAVFLGEAFTRRVLMEELAMSGFQQSYTYFTWKRSRREIEEYVADMTRGDLPEYFRPNLFVNTPDILTAELQDGGPPAFAARAVLASTLAPSWGMYSGFEWCEGDAARPGSEEYRDSEKYEVRRRSLGGPLLPLVSRLNAIRRECPALQRWGNTRFLDTRNENLIAYARTWAGSRVVVVVNLDPHHAHEGLVDCPADIADSDGGGIATDLLDGRRFPWHAGGNYVRLDPADGPAHIMVLGGA